MFLGYELRNVEGMKSQLMTALSIVGVLGTATTAMAVNTDALANFDPGAIGTATDTLLPGTPVPADPAAPIATPAPTEPSNTPSPVDPAAPQSGVTTPGGTSGSSPVVQNPQAAPVNGTTGGSGSRVEPASGAVVNDDEEDDHDEDEDEDHEEDHEEEDDD